MTTFLSVLSGVISLTAVVISYIAVDSSSRVAEANRIFSARSEAYVPVVEAVVELRDYSQRLTLDDYMNDDRHSVPVLTDGRWLTLLAKVELLATESVRREFEIIPGHVMRFRLGLQELQDARSPMVEPEERRESFGYQRQHRQALADQCEAVLAAIRSEMQPRLTSKTRLFSRLRQ